MSILHRKETFVAATYPHIDLLTAITQEGEALGLYENPRSIGFKQNWLRLIARKGSYLDDAGRLQERSQVDETLYKKTNVSVERHKTAINRNQLSAPMQILARHNYLSGDYSLLDYGCGKGDDVRNSSFTGLILRVGILFTSQKAS